ncbi:MAG: bifunctional adenosylcobinamide kinase/adenosylcobinamide-phosphate guanylyltransferase [Lachnospiraceae bacterium]|nr:bifunctional adenosylcobinamide kinase/adenosylcobinamide-phosphate guanylyltransferase [Lachnospiraceae bacterium]
MITFIAGGPDTGKSRKAESIATKDKYKDRYYIATMKVVDEDGIKRKEKHKKMREGKGFKTFEIPVDVCSVVPHMENPRNSVVLLECVSNLVGNVMYDTGWRERLKSIDTKLREEFVKYILDIITELSKKVGHLIVVSSSYDPEETDDEETALYKELLTEVNLGLNGFSDKVIWL